MVVLLLTIIGNTYFTNALHLRPVVPCKDVTSVHIVDVGQGSCTLMHFASGEDMIIDSGTPNCSTKLMNYINNVFFLHGDKTFEYAILTHSDSDHSGNMSYILSHYKVGTFYRPNIISTLAGETAQIGDAYIDSENTIYADVITTLNNHTEINVVTNYQDVTITHNGATLLNMYSPTTDCYDNVNDYSPIMILGDNKLKVCITGDASSEVEIRATNDYTLPDVDVLVLGHHGSNSSTSSELLEALQPEQVAVSVGDNIYGHPSSETYQRLINYDQTYGKHTFDNILVTRTVGNIIYYGTPDGYSHMIVSKVDSYLHVDYYVLVIITIGVLLVVFVRPMGGKKSNKRVNTPKIKTKTK